MEDVYVTNNGDDTLTDSWCGVPYVFVKGVTVQIPQGAAQHIFGHGMENKETYLARLGWIKLHSDVPQGLEKLAQFSISATPPQKDSYQPSAVGVVPLHVKRHAGGKSLQRQA